MADADPIAAYLARLRAGLKVAPAEAELIMTEAEDHLRETTAAAIAVGMTEREAQEAAISSFGPADAVIKAHQTRVNRAALRSGEAALAALRLTSVLALTGGMTGLATTASLLAAGRAGVWMYGYLARGPRGSVVMARPRQWTFVLGSAPGHLAIIGKMVIAPSALTWLICALAVVVGVASLGIYRHVRRRATVRRELLAGAFPVVATGFCGALGVATIGLCQVGTWAAIVPGMIAATVVLAAGCVALKLREARG
jgi:hypothetical protein